MEFRAENTRWFVNNTALSGQTHVLRTALQMQAERDRGGSLAFDLPAADQPRQLALWLYAPEQAADMDCRLQLEAPQAAGPGQAFNFRNYHYRLYPADYPAAQLLRGGADSVRGPIKLTLPLAADNSGQSTRAQLWCDRPDALVSGGIVAAGQAPYQYFEEHYDIY